MLNQGELLTLDDNRKYFVISSVMYNGKNYVYLLDKDNYSNNMFCVYDNKTGLDEVTDLELIKELSKLCIEKF